MWARARINAMQREQDKKSSEEDMIENHHIFLFIRPHQRSCHTLNNLVAARTSDVKVGDIGNIKGGYSRCLHDVDSANVQYLKKP